MRPVIKFAKILMSKTLGEDRVTTYVGFASRTVRFGYSSFVLKGIDRSIAVQWNRADV
jgi:hypothetical protein